MDMIFDKGYSSLHPLEKELVTKTSKNVTM